MNYVATPTSIRLSDVLGKKTSLSPNNFSRVVVSEAHSKPLKDLLSSAPLNGEEVGSASYIPNSDKYFIRTKALQPSSLLLNHTNDGIIPILPSSFKDHGLKEGDIIISKDSNIGEVIILDRDYPSYMLSNGLYKLTIADHKFYILALIKHSFFKTQLGFMVSKGATIKHAKTLFLDCLIPFPISDKERIIETIETNTKLIIQYETRVRELELEIETTLDNELGYPEKLKDYTYSFPRISNLRSLNRIDAGFYGEDFMGMQWLIESHKNGSGTLEDWGYTITRGQNLQISAIGKSIYSDDFQEGFYKLARPVNLSDFGTVEKYEYLGNKNNLSVISKGDIVFSAEGSVGKCVMFTDPGERVITNIHGIVLNKEDHDTLESSYVSSFLRYLRKKGVLDFISVGGQGGSLAMQYFGVIKVPNLDEATIERVSKSYYNPEGTSFSEWGITELDSKIKDLNQANDRLLADIIEQHRTQ
jgi:hypothetical protein